jgi:hypothetical protein
VRLSFAQGPTAIPTTEPRSLCANRKLPAAATHLVATAPTPRPVLLLTIPRTAPTTSTADQSVSAEVMQPPIETSLDYATRLPCLRCWGLLATSS